jgi:uncharacterized Zn-binding protein involved in type VI secretion
MLGLARFTDIFSGVCYCHKDPIYMTGIICTTSSDTGGENFGFARCTDVVVGGCGHVGIIVTCSSNVIINNLGAARIGDFVTGCLVGTIVTSSGTIFLT